MYKLGWINWARLLVWLIIGLVIYFTYSRHHSRLSLGRDIKSAPTQLKS
jgi:APA family basic amino acid/polyamine antiporter